MKKYIFLTALFLISTITFSQSYQKGYVLKSTGEKIDCYINTNSFSPNEKPIEYKLNLESNEVIKVDFNEFQEVKLLSPKFFVKKEVQIETSSDKINSLSQQRNPSWVKKEVFLEVLTKSNVILYRYKGYGKTQFFYSKEGDSLSPKPLLFKKYLTAENTIAFNNAYKQELRNLFKDCDQLQEEVYISLSYKQSELIDLFKSYAKCNTSDIEVFDTNFLKTKIKYNVFGGINQTSVNFVHDRVEALNVDFGSSSLWRVGAEVEFQLPFDDNNWAFFVGVAKNKNIDKTRTIATSSFTTPLQDVTFTFDSVEAHLGAKYYLPVNESNDVIFLVGYLKDFVKEFSLNYEISMNEGGDRRGENFFLGAGYAYKNIFFETRLNLGKDVGLENTESYTTTFNSTAFTIGYSF